jgi:prophage regulatory protein
MSYNIKSHSYLGDFMQALKATTRAIRLPEVCHLTGMSRATIWRKSRGGDFPQPFHVSEAITAWDEGEILDWIHSKKDNVVQFRPRG